jgi:galactokinase
VPVTASSIAAALVTRGLDPRDLIAKQSLYTGVVERHSMLRGRPPEHVWWVPGRLEVFGKHTDYAGGRTLVSPVSRGFAVAASARDDGIVQVVDAWRAESVLVPVKGDPVGHSGWRRYVEVAVRRLARNFPGAPLGADIVIASDLPRASGMSSSSALVIAIAAALGKIAALPRHPAWKLNIRSGLDAAGYYACIENGRDFAALQGDAGVGTHGGSEDHAAIVEGRTRMVSAFAFVPARALGAEEIPDDWRFVIAPSGVPARKTGDALEPYNRLSRGVSRLLETWNTEGPRALSLAAALKSDRSAIDRLRALADRAATPDMPAEWLRERLEHFLREDGRPLPAMAAFAARDHKTIGELASESQSDAERLLRNQVLATSALATSARTHGAFAAASFGAGFGGAVWALMHAGDAEGFAQKWHPDAFVVHAGLPLTDLS